MNDVRLAIPVGVAWIVLAALAGVPDVLPIAWPAAALVAIVAILVAARASGTVRAILAIVAMAAAASALLLASAATRASDDIASCDVITGSLDGRATTPMPISVASGRCGGEAVQLAATALVVALEEPLGADAGVGARVRLAGCEAWAGDPGGRSAWMLACREATILGAPWWSSWSAEAREAFHAATAGLPGDGGALLTGLAIGDERRVDEGLRTAMLDASLSHLTAVSGANCAIVVAAAFGIAAALGAGRSVRVVAAALALAAFVVLVTPEPSVVRAAGMAALALVGLWSGRRASGLALVALAVLALLWLDPPLARSAGFALSTLATTGLIVHGRALGTLLARILPGPLAVATAIPLAAQLWCMPVLVALDASVSPLGVLANLVVAPAAPVVTVVGMLACIAASLAPAVASALAWIAWVPSAWIGGVARLVAELPLVRVPWPAGPTGIALAVAIVALVVVGVARASRRCVVAALVLTVCTPAVTAVPTVALRASVPDWSIAQCDVGQGSATLVRVGGDVALIDTGAEDERILACLDLLGVGRIRILVLTHFDHDHAGAARALTGRVDLVVHGPMDDGGARLIADLAAGGAAVDEAVAGDAWMLGDARLDALWPPPRVAPGNDASVVVDATLPGVDVLVLGDLGAQAQARLLRNGVPTAEVVVAAHHGSADQDPRTYERIGAAVALVGVGENDYGHPTRAALDQLAAAGSAALRTDELGSIAIDASLVVWAEHPP